LENARGNGSPNLLNRKLQEEGITTWNPGLKSGSRSTNLGGGRASLKAQWGIKSEGR